MRIWTILFAALTVLVAEVGHATTIHVPADQPTIQAGIVAAVAGDTVLVAPGAYQEHIDFLGRDVVVRSSAGRDVTFIEAVEHERPIVSFVSGEDTSSVLDGFTIRYAFDAECIYCEVSSPIIRNCDISFSQELGRRGNGILTKNAAPQIRNNRIHDNSATRSGGAIRVTGSAAYSGVFLEIAYNDIYNNWAPKGGGISTNHISVLSIHHNLIRGNFANEDEPALEIIGSGAVFNNTIVDNGIGIQAFSSTTDIRNNIIVNNAIAGILPGSASNDYNDVWNNGSANDPGPNGISVDPQFIDPLNGDYGLQSSSPCIDAGDPDSAYLDSDSSRSDIGAGNMSGPPHVPFDLCPLEVMGDVNGSRAVTSADILYLVNHVFKGGAAPVPCSANGDCDCSGTITSADIIRLLRFIFGAAARGFKGGDPPCNSCPLILKGIWNCP